MRTEIYSLFCCIFQWLEEKGRTELFTLTFLEGQLKAEKIRKQIWVNKKFTFPVVGDYHFFLFLVCHFQFDLINFLLLSDVCLSLTKGQITAEKTTQFYLLSMRFFPDISNTDDSRIKVTLCLLLPSGFNNNESHETSESLICFMQKCFRCGAKKQKA